MGGRPQPKVRWVLGKLCGVVQTAKMHKTVVVEMPYKKTIWRYDLEINRRTKVWAHDEFELCRPGDLVKLKMCRPLAENKAHYVDKILSREDKSPPPNPFPNAHNVPDELIDVGSEAYMARHKLTGRYGSRFLVHADEKTEWRSLPTEESGDEESAAAEA